MDERQGNLGEGVLPLLMKLQESVTSLGGKIERLDERIGEALKMSPRLDTLEDRVLKIETETATLRGVTATLKAENDARLARLWSAVQGVAGAVGALLLLALWAWDHFRLR